MGELRQHDGCWTVRGRRARAIAADDVLLTAQYANNRAEADHGRLKERLRPMRGLKRDRTASVVIQGHAFMQNLRRGHYEVAIHALPGLTVSAAFDELARMV